MNRREADPGIWYDVDDKKLYGSEYLPVPIGPFTFENAMSSLWPFGSTMLNPIGFATAETANNILGIIKVLFAPDIAPGGPAAGELEAKLHSATQSSFFGTKRSVPERSIIISRYTKPSSTVMVLKGSETFNAGRIAKNIMANGFPYAMYSFEAELVYAGLLKGTGPGGAVDPTRILYYRELQQKTPLY